MQQIKFFVIGLFWVWVATGSLAAAQFDSNRWIIRDSGGTLVTNLTDNNPETLVTLQNTKNKPPGLTVEFRKSRIVHRVFLCGKKHKLEMWDWYKNRKKKPLGLIVVSIGDKIDALAKVAEFMIPYDGGNPIDIEADLRFSPVSGHYVRIELQNAVDDARWNIGELEIYGFKGVENSKRSEAVILPKNAATPLLLAADELSYYLGELSGKPHPIINEEDTANYSGTLYHVVDLKPLAPDYYTMMKNIANGKLPDGVNVEKKGRNVYFKTWPYRCVLWSVWEFLERQGVRWLYPDSHGDFVPVGKGIKHDIFPLKYTPSASTIYANWNADCFQPWPHHQKQTLRQSALYPWRNRWTSTWGNRTGPLGGREIPRPKSLNYKLSEEYKERFSGYPHNFDKVVPPRIRKLHPDWWGYSKKEGKRVPWKKYSDPQFCMSNPELIKWVADKMIEVSKTFPRPKKPLAVTDWQMVYNLLPMDSCRFCYCKRCLKINGPKVKSRLSRFYERSMSGVYFYFVSEVARRVRERAPEVVVGALAYSNVNYPPENIKTLPENTYVDLCLYGDYNLSMNSSGNKKEEKFWKAWRKKCGRFSTYDYCLLHIGHSQADPQLPVPLVTAIVDRAKLLYELDMLTGCCQATPQSLPYNPWSFYAYPRIRWNVNQTADQLLKEFFDGYFQEAGESMLAYYKTMEDHLIKNNINLGAMYLYQIVPGSFPLHVLAKMKRHLKKAEKVAKSWIVKERVVKMREGFVWVIEKRILKGVDLNTISNFPKVTGTGKNPFLVDLAKMRQPTHGLGHPGNYTSFRNGEWFFGAHGQIETSLFFPKSRKYTVEIVARSKPYDGVFPVMNVFVGHVKVGSVSVDSTEDKKFIFKMDVPQGVRDIVIIYENAAQGGRRNLIIKDIQIEKQ